MWTVVVILNGCVTETRELDTYTEVWNYLASVPRALTVSIIITQRRQDAP